MGEKKLVSYCLFTYNQENYVKEAIEGALNQTYIPLEIIISDDCSTDNTFRIIEETLKNYSGPHKIILNRNKINLGIGGHFSKVCYSIVKGEYVVILGGDDISNKDHVKKAVAVIEENPSINMVDFNAEIIDKNGNHVRNIELDYNSKKFTLDDFLKVRFLQHFAPGRIFKRKLINTYNPIIKNCKTEDIVLVIRSILSGGFIRVNLPLVKYRIHDSNLSSSNSLSSFSNFSIIAQHIVDVIHLYNENKINEELAKSLIKRIDLELKFRELKFSKSKNYLHAKFKLLFVNFLKYMFLVKKNINLRFK